MKIKKIWLAGILLIIFGLFFAACEEVTQPVYGPGNPDPNPTGKAAASVTSISPQEGFLRDVITISGSGFSTDPDGNVVRFGSVVGQVISQSATELQVVAPVLSDVEVKVKVAVKGAEFWSNEMDFKFNLAVEVIDDETNWPNGVAADESGNIYLASAGDEIIYKITPDGDKSEFAAVPVNGAMHFSPSGSLYICEKGEGKIVRISADGGTIEDVVEIGDPVDFDWDADGNMYIVADGEGIHKLDDTGTLTLLAELGSGKSIRIYETTLFITDVWESTIWKFDITAGGLENQEAVYEGDSPLGIEVDADGTMYFTEAWEVSLYTMDQDGNESVLFDGELATPMHYLLLKDKFIYAVYPGWGDVGELWKIYVGVEEAPR